MIQFVCFFSFTYRYFVIYIPAYLIRPYEIDSLFYIQ